MPSRFARALTVLAAMAVLYAGPVAACICVDQPMPEMPCCPGDPQDSEATQLPADLASYSDCTFVPADLLPCGPQDLPSPVAISSAIPPEWSPRAPPEPRLRTSPTHYHSPPIYLVTLRLRN